MNKNSIAFGTPGIEPRWTSSAKDGIGTAYHSSSGVWFTLSHGIVNEIYSLWVRYLEACFGLVGRTELGLECMGLE